MMLFFAEFTLKVTAEQTAICAILVDTYSSDPFLGLAGDGWLADL